MSKFIKADLYKLRKTTTIYILFSISLVTALIVLFVMNQMATGDMSADMGTNISLITDTMLVGIFGGIIIGDLVVEDFSTKFIHNKIMSGKGRKSIILSKVVSFIIYFSIVLSPYFIIAIVAAACGKKFAPLLGIPSAFFDLIAGYSSQSNSEMLKYILLAVVIIVIYIARLSICFPFAFKIQKKIPVLVVGFVTSFIFDIVFSLVKDINVLSDFVKLLPYYQMTQITIDASSKNIIGALASSVVFLAVMVEITYLLFKKSEIK